MKKMKEDVLLVLFNILLIMEYRILEWTIDDLINLYDQEKLNLTPPYQRNDIWLISAKRKLINTIYLGFPLPAFFLQKMENDTYEIVDGQQRTRTILGYNKKLFPEKGIGKFDEIPKEKFLKYRLAIIVIENETDINLIQEFYYRVNKLGMKINRPETLKGRYHETPFQNLVEKITGTNEFVYLSLFSEASLNRMNDMDFVGELLALIKFGTSDKKEKVDKLYEDLEITSEEINQLELKFNDIISKINTLSNIFPINKTRYKQRNDFYTLFNFILVHKEIDSETLSIFYKILVLIDSDISPSNEDCFAFQDYAINCVSQSNSKKARDARLDFFEKLLLNPYENPTIENEHGQRLNEILYETLQFYFKGENKVIKIAEYYTLDTSALNEKKKIF